MKLYAHLILTVQLAAARSLHEALSSVQHISRFREYLDLFGVDPYEHSLSGIRPIVILAPSDKGYAETAANGIDLTMGCPMHARRMLQYSILDQDFRLDGNATIAVSAMKGRNTTAYTPVRLFFDRQDKYAESGLGTLTKVIGHAIGFDGGKVYVVESPPVAPAQLDATLQSIGAGAFAETLEAYGLRSTFESLHDATIFVPPPPAQTQRADMCPMTLLNHAVAGHVVLSDRLEAGEERVYHTMAGQEILVAKMPCGRLLVNGRRVVRQDLTWAGGVIHVLEDVMLPAEGLRPTATVKIRPSLLSRLFGGATSVLEAACLAALAMSLVALVQLYRNIRQLEKVLHQRSAARLEGEEGDETAALLYRNLDMKQEATWEA